MLLAIAELSVYPLPQRWFFVCKDNVMADKSSILSTVTSLAKQGFSQSKIGQLLGVPRGTVYNWLHPSTGRGQPSKATVKEVAPKVASAKEYGKWASETAKKISKEKNVSFQKALKQVASKYLSVREYEKHGSKVYEYSTRPGASKEEIQKAIHNATREIRGMGEEPFSINVQKEVIYKNGKKEWKSTKSWDPEDDFAWEDDYDEIDIDYNSEGTGGVSIAIRVVL